jgi:hypothetical protein
MSEITFYYQPNSQRKSEAAFFYALKSRYPNSQVFNEHFLVSNHYLDQFINTQKVISWLQTNTLLPNKRRLACIQLLQNCPSKSLRVALKPNDISFDVVAKKDGKIYYWEFHEKQRQRLSVDRPNTTTKDHITTKDRLLLRNFALSSL